MPSRCWKFTIVFLVILVNATVGSQCGHFSSVQGSFPRRRRPNTSSVRRHDSYHYKKSINRCRAGALNTNPQQNKYLREHAAKVEAATANSVVPSASLPVAPPVAPCENATAEAVETVEPAVTVDDPKTFANSSSSDVSFMEKRGLAVVQLSSLLSMLSTTLVAFAPASALVKKLGSAKATSLLSILSASSAVIEILFSPSVGRFMDASGRKRPLLAVLSAMAISQLTVVLSDGSISSMCVVKFVCALGIGLFFQTIGQAILTDVTGRGSCPERLSSALGMQAALISIGFLVGALSAGKLQSTYGLTATYGIASILAFTNAILVAVALPETLESSSELQPKARKSFLRLLTSCIDILKRPNEIPVLAAIFALQSLPQFMGDFFQIFCKTEWDLDTSAFSQFVAMFGVLGLVSNLLGSLLVRRLGIRKFTLVTTLLAIIPSICAGLWGFRGLLGGYVVAFLGMAQNLGIMSALVSEGKKEDIPIGELTGERAALMGLVKISGPILYSTLYVQGKRLWDIPGSPFIFNALLGIVVFSLSFYHVR